MEKTLEEINKGMGKLELLMDLVNDVQPNWTEADILEWIKEKRDQI